MWGYIVGAVIVYFVFQKNIKQIRAWIKRHEELIDKWKSEPEIMEAYELLRGAIETANLDRRWSVFEIVTVLGLAIKLFELIKRFEEGGEG